MTHHWPGSQPQLVCPECGAESPCIVTIDEGFAYEYWGAKGYHQQLVDVTACCGAEAIEGGSATLEHRRQVAKKFYAPDIRPGDLYERTVTKVWKVGGPHWYIVERRRVYAMGA